jgi:hypothetical protein
VGHVVEFNWGGDWHEAEFLKMALDADGDEICHLLHAKTGDTHQIQFRENDLDDAWQDCLDWWPLFDCYACDVPTRGLGVCEICHARKDGSVEGDSDDE